MPLPGWRAGLARSRWIARRAGWSGCWPRSASLPVEVTREDVDRVVGSWAAAGIAASTRRTYLQAFKGFHEFLTARKASEIEAVFGVRLESPLDEFNAARHVACEPASATAPPSPERLAEFFEPLAARARQRAARRASLRERSPMRRPGGQPGHRGAGLEPRVTRTGPGRLIRRLSAGRAGRGWPALGWRAGDGGRCGISRRCGWRRCTGWCRSCAAAPAGRSPRLTRLVGGPGQWSDGPDVNAAAIVVDNQGNVPAERTAMLMGALLGAPVSAGSSPARMSGVPGGWKRPGSMRR